MLVFADGLKRLVPLVTIVSVIAMLLVSHAAEAESRPNFVFLLADTDAGVYQGEPAKAGYQARDLAEFEACYRGLMEMSLAHPQIIGFAWCGWYETPDGHPNLRSGIVDCRTDEPLADRLAIVTQWNRWMAREFEKRATESD
jgi:hypothetical protein